VVLARGGAARRAGDAAARACSRSRAERCGLPLLDLVFLKILNRSAQSDE
jgi:hypothetical protein